MRIGIGYDVHRLVSGRKLIIGGIEIEHSLGLLGHSDADVLIHAIMDSLLGAICKRDIGFHFPDTDQKYKDIDSKELLKEVSSLVLSSGYRISNIDSIVMAEKPKLSPYIPRMQEVLANILNISKSQINIKATTTEGLGFVGKEEGISAQAVCLLEEDI